MGHLQALLSPCTVCVTVAGTQPLHTPAGTGGPASGDVSPGGNSCTPRTSARPQVRTERAGGRCSASTPGRASALLLLLALPLVISSSGSHGTQRKGLQGVGEGLPRL
ncbi:hypothetical protein AV530_008117 [Patagioenas fasciata monilis]|uniref:Uncharacterized protein n=1 Tax=Patagioenas fasciata monilis TaxID=372326 RepID=A0A1V4KUS5_PATFA|nr:hypothetical protein AV530_008117 [Patagioenas fasciata monilis]